MRFAGVLLAVSLLVPGRPARALTLPNPPVQRGNGETATEWRSDPLPLKAGWVYRLTFRARSVDGAGGTATSGPPFCNRDLGDPGAAWHEYDSVFFTPAVLPPEEARVRFGQWMRRGGVEFSGATVDPCDAVYDHAAGFELGDGERVTGTVYEYAGPGGGASGNHARPLFSHRAGFNTNRWVLGPGGEVVYRHAVGGRTLLAATIEAGVTYHVSGTLVVEASANGREWIWLGVIPGEGHRAFPLAAPFVPGRTIWVRLSTRPAAAGGPVELQVGAYGFRAILDGAAVRAAGRTRFIATTANDPRFDVAFDDLGEGFPGVANLIAARTTGFTTAPVVVQTTAVSTRNGDPLISTKYTGKIMPGERTLKVPYPVTGPGEYRVELTFGLDSPYRAEFRFRVPALYDEAFGAVLPGSLPGVGLWWCTAGWKVSRTRALPVDPAPAIRIAAAANEAEAAQVVVRPTLPVTALLPVVGDLKGPGRARIPAASVDLLWVRHVAVEHPSDAAGAVGDWPDPLIPVTVPVDLEAGRNAPLWVRVRVPRGTPPGTYTGTIRFNSAAWHASATLLVEVYGFDLPDRMTLDSAFGFDADLMFKYHHLTDERSRRRALDLYWADFAAHHVGPFAYDTAPLDPAPTVWTRTADADGPVPVIDWKGWDREMARMFKTYQFGSFTFGVPGMWGGDGDARPELAGFREGTTGYETAFHRWCVEAQTHLEQKGWLDRAFVYWEDEPQEKDFPRVMAGMNRLKTHLPRVRRLLTKEPRPELEGGGVNLWCPILDTWDHDRDVVRRKPDEQFWWYICTGPKEPFVGEFIDRPSPDLRVWCWQSWAESVTGILIWATDYWTSRAAFPDPEAPQNPYGDPESWVREGAPGFRGEWGNGDGRFLYPPLAAADGHPAKPLIEGPVDSIRWEHLRDGIEDYEYLAILKRLLAAKGAALSAADRKAMTDLLIVPPEISSSLTTWTKNDTAILARRDALALAIERLSR